MTQRAHSPLVCTLSRKQELKFVARLSHGLVERVLEKFDEDCSRCRDMRSATDLHMIIINVYNGAKDEDSLLQKR